jgi:hypothetical protein
LDTAGDQISGWQNGGNLIRTAYGNIENYRTLVSANTAKFLGPVEARTVLISKLDAIADSQEKIREAFMAWANLNRAANAELGGSEPQQKVAYLQSKGRVIALFDEIVPLAANAASQLKQKLEQVDKDIAGLRKTISSKQVD